MKTIGVIDIGKTNVKLVLFDELGHVLWQMSAPNRPLAADPYPHADVEAIWSFILAALKEGNAAHQIDVIVPTSHGATGALIDAHGLVLPIMDYEFSRLHEIDPLYEPMRPEFSRSYSPSLPTGLNLGRQMAWLAWHHKVEFAKATAFLTYPQYWLWRLTGTLTSDITSIGCHTDLWLPGENKPSALADALGLSQLMPPFRPGWEACGTLRPEIVRETGIGAQVPVLCGIHDSNAALLPYLAGGKAPFTVLSTGTWVVIMAVGHSLESLRAEDDMMANIDVNGHPTACARFMGGREFALISGDCTAEPSEPAVGKLIEKGVFALPSFSPHGGPFASHEGHIAGDITPDERTSLATLYCALMSDHILTRLGITQGDIIIDGSFARNGLFCALLAQLRPGQHILRAPDQAGSARGAALLATWPEATFAPELIATPAARLPGLDDYRAVWLGQISGLNTCD